MQEYRAFSKSMGLPVQAERVYQDGLGGGKKYRLSSTASHKRSLEYVRNGRAGLSQKRKSLLLKVPNSGDWKRIEIGSVSKKDIAFLSAYTNHEFAIWESKTDTILCHGTKYHCDLPADIYDLLLSGKYKLIAHTHVDMGELAASSDDRRLLKEIGQDKSVIVSIDGREAEFSSNMFDVN